MKLELHGMGSLTANTFNPLTPGKINTTISPFVAPTIVTPIAPPKTTLVQKISTGIDKFNNTAQTLINAGQQIKQVFNPNQVPQGMTPQQYQAYLQAQAQAEKDRAEDNTMLYVALAGGGLLLAGVAVALVKKKKKRGMGRVKRKAKSLGRVPRKRAKRTVRKSVRKRKTSKRKR
jgi:LPXTG-motif cell wall-anchored protein